MTNTSEHESKMTNTSEHESKMTNTSQKSVNTSQKRILKEAPYSFKPVMKAGLYCVIARGIVRILGGTGADLGFFVPQSKFVWRTGCYRRWAWSRLGVVDSRHEGGGGSGR